MHRIRWEYRIVTAPEAEELNALGEEGWELVSAVVIRGLEKLYLKRPAPSISEEITLAQREAVLRGNGT